MPIPAVFIVLASNMRNSVAPLPVVLDHEARIHYFKNCQQTYTRLFLRILDRFDAADKGADCEAVPSFRRLDIVAVLEVY